MRFTKGFLEGKDQGEGGVAVLGTPDRDIGSPNSRGICDTGFVTQRVEFELGEPVVRSADTCVATVCKAAPEVLNAFEMGRVLGVALELELDNENEGFVSSEELERGVRMLLGESEEGKKVRRVEEMKVASRKAVQAGSSSATVLQSIIKLLLSEMPTK